MSFPDLFDLNHDGHVSPFEMGEAFAFGQMVMEEEDRRWGGYDPDGKTKDYITDDWHTPWDDEDDVWDDDDIDEDDDPFA